MGSFVLCFARLLKLHVKCCQRICLLVSVLVHSVTSGRNDSFIDKVAVTKPVCLSLLLDCWNSQQSSGRTGECLCHCALTLAGKSIISSIFDYFSLKLDHWFRKPFRGPTSLDNVDGGLIIIAEDPPKSHIGAPEHFLLSQERSPVRKNPQHISVFCTFGASYPRHSGVCRGLICATEFVILVQVTMKNLLFCDAVYSGIYLPTF